MMVMHKAGGTNKDEFLAKFGLNKAKMEIMYYVAHHQSVSVKLLAEKMSITSSAATQLIDGLVENGWLKRTHDKDDRRSVLVTMSEKGKTKFSKFKKAHLQRIAEKMVALSDEDLDTLITIYKKVLDSKIK